jgi:hypothetical protein
MEKLLPSQSVCTQSRYKYQSRGFGVRRGNKTVVYVCRSVVDIGSKKAELKFDFANAFIKP